MVAFSKIKICYIIDTFVGADAGTEKQLVQLINNLNKNKFDIYLCCLYRNDRQRNFDSILLNCKIKILNFNNISKLNFILVTMALARYLKKENIDIVHTFLSESVYVGTIAAKIAVIPRIITSRRSMGYWYKTIDILLLRIFNKFTNSISVNSFSVKQMVIEIEKCAEEKINVIYNGIDILPFERYEREGDDLRYELGITQKEYVIGMVANLRPVKGIEIYFDALKKIKDEGVHFKAILVGSGEPSYEKQLYELANQLGLKEDVIFVGRQDHDNVVRYLKVFDIGVLSSISEGFSNSIIEYMAAGLPIVATSTGGNKELIEDTNNYLVPVGNSDLLAARIKDLLYDDSRRMQIRKMSLDIVKRKYRWEHIILEWEKYYCNLIEGLSIK